jgi:hypothetical protein
VHESVRRRARDLLLEGAAKSSYLRGSVIDGFLNLSFGYSSQQCIDKRVEDTDVSREEDRDDPVQRHEAVLPLGARTESKSQGMQQMAERNILDVSWR